MSNQLTIAAAFSTLAMAAFALASPHIAAGGSNPQGVFGTELETAAPFTGKAPGLPGLADLIQ